MEQAIRNLMPLEDLSDGPESLTVSKWRADVERERTRGRVLWNYVVQEQDSGNCVGVTNVCFNPEDPRIVYQWDTGVLEHHQRRGIGKALKLLMLRRILRDLPQARLIETENARSNDAMVGINSDLGFREVRTARAYEMAVDQLRKLALEKASA
jgi:RimJ/RimL family protein N-acetyltransferase